MRRAGARGSLRRDVQRVTLSLDGSGVRSSFGERRTAAAACSRAAGVHEQCVNSPCAGCSSVA
ncbi:hypothetical protein Dimus_022729, partial [Dionaea muscipula]